MTIKSFINRYSSLLMALAVLVALFLFWFVGYPQALNYQEENQLFLLSTDYFLSRIAVAGGLADWIGEFIVQFYYLPWLGALALAFLGVAVQRLTLAVVSHHASETWTLLILSLLPVVLLTGVMGNENVLLSYEVALAMVLAATLGLRRISWWGDIVIVPLLYWLAGPMTVLYALLRIVDNWRKEWWTILWFLAVELMAYAFILDEYPLKEVLLGINYYRIPLVLDTPCTLWIVPAVVVLLAVLGKQNDLTDLLGRKWIAACACLIVAVAAVLSVKCWYPKDRYELLMQDWLVREGHWQDVIDRAEKYQVRTTYSSNAVNLALAMTGQLADRQFEFYQDGPSALIMPSVRDNFSNLPSAEAFYHLGMINSAKRYMYDIQESILNGRKSGRCMKRIAECFILNGQYKVAKKYLDVLKQSLFYRSWAEEAEQCLYDEVKINANPEWGYLRRVRYKKNYMYDYGQMDKLLGLLVVNNNDNKMAMDYYMAQLLLNVNIRDFMNYVGWVMQQRGYVQLPAGYQDAVRCIQSHGTAPGSVYAGYVKTRVMSNGVNDKQ